MKPETICKLCVLGGVIGMLGLVIWGNPPQPKKTNVEHLTITSIEVKTNSIRFNVEITY